MDALIPSLVPIVGLRKVSVSHFRENTEKDHDDNCDGTGHGPPLLSCIHIPSLLLLTVCTRIQSAALRNNETSALRFLFGIDLNVFPEMLSQP